MIATNSKQPPHNHDFIAERIRLVMALRRGGISDTAVLSAIENTPRELFVDERFLDQAYEDIALPIASGQTISQPTVVAWMTQALELTPRSRVLEIGTGSGYQAAILARLARRVYTIERHRELHNCAAKIFERLKLMNITTRLGDGSKGWKEAAPFDRIIVTCGAEDMPPLLLDQLAPEGIMVIPVGAGSHQRLLKITRDEQGNVSEEELMAVRFVPLVERLGQ